MGGRTRQRLAELLVEAFKTLGVEARIDPADLIPARGYWRTDHRADVYRWEGSFERLIDGRWIVGAIDSWDTMTDCVRHGLTISRDHRAVGYEANANETRTHPVVARKTALQPKASDQ